MISYTFWTFTLPLISVTFAVDDELFDIVLFIRQQR